MVDCVQVFLDKWGQRGIIDAEGHCRLRYSPRWLKFRNRNRHRPGWRFLPFILIVTVYPKICNVSVIGMCLTSFRRIDCTAHRLWQRLFCPNPYQWAWLFHHTTAKPGVARDFDKFSSRRVKQKTSPMARLFIWLTAPGWGKPPVQPAFFSLRAQGWDGDSFALPEPLEYLWVHGIHPTHLLGEDLFHYRL